MLDRIEDLAQSGARDAARQLLSELQNMLENLQAGRPMMGNQQANQMMQSLNQLGDMIRRQQQLMDETHPRRARHTNGERRADDRGGDSEALRNLQQGQQGFSSSSSSSCSSSARWAWSRTASSARPANPWARRPGARRRQPRQRARRQGQALEALRQGAQGLAQQLAEQGQGRGPGGMRGGENFPNEDPLGRPQRTTGPDLGTTVKVPDEIDTQRAREILDAIRKRLGERPAADRARLSRAAARPVLDVSRSSRPRPRRRRAARGRHGRRPCHSRPRRGPDR